MGYVITWFEIPTSNIQRAAKFYGEVLDCEIGIHEMNGSPMGFFPAEERGDVTGALVQETNRQPSQNGTTVYFYIEGDLTSALNRVEPAGGKVLSPKTIVTEEIGYVAFFQDTEGNRVALHSMA